MTKMSNQEAFDASVRHIRRQGGPSYDRGCKYRTSDGRKCAVGCLIPDPDFDPRWEGTAAFDIEEKKREYGEHSCLLIREQAFGEYLRDHFEDVRLLRKLQDAHDGISGPSVVSSVYEPREWMARFIVRAQIVAEYFELKLDALTEALQ